MNKDQICDVCDNLATTSAVDSLRVTDLGYTHYAPLYDTVRYRCEEHFEDSQTLDLKYPNNFTKKWNSRRNK